MKRVAILAALTTAGCATIPDHRYNPDDQRRKEASVAHAYGAGFVMAGLGAIIGGGAVIAADQAGSSSNSSVATAGGIQAGAGVLFVAIGVYLVTKGNNLYTPEPTEFSPRLMTPRAKRQCSDFRGRRVECPPKASTSTTWGGE